MQVKDPIKSVKFCKVNYIPKLFENIRHALAKFDIASTELSPPKLRVVLNIKIDSIQDINKSGVYSIPFKTGSKEYVYIGMILRKLQKSLKEHDADLRLGKPHIALSRFAQTAVIFFLIAKLTLFKRRILEFQVQKIFSFEKPVEKYFKLIREELTVLLKENHC